MNKSPLTKKYSTLAFVFSLFSVLLNITPILTYVIIGFAQADLVTEKIGLSCTVLVVLLLSAIAWINKTTLRSRIWIILIGLYFCLDFIETPLIIIGITQIVDEWFVAPAAASFKNKLTINKQIDKRLS